MLPLTNLTGQPEYDATAVGIAEVVVAGLTGIDGIQVLSRLATTGYRDRKGDLPAHRPRARRELPRSTASSSARSSTCG